MTDKELIEQHVREHGVNKLAITDRSAQENWSWKSQSVARGKRKFKERQREAMDKKLEEALRHVSNDD